MSHNSTNISSSSESTNAEEQNVINFAKHMLKGRIFSGSYQEKRHIRELNTYRNVVTVDNKESMFINDLNLVLKRLRGYYKTKWIGITTPDMVGTPAQYCLWVQLEEELFGSYNYKVKTIKFSKNEITLQLKQVVNVNENLEREKTDIDFDFQAIGTKLKNELKLGAISFTELLTFNNFKQTVIFLSVLLIALFTALVNLLQFLANYSLKLMHELSKLIHAFTPIILRMLGIVEKMVMGVYYLIAVLFKGDQRPPPQYRGNMIQYDSVSPRYRKSGGVQIREIEY